MISVVVTIPGGQEYKIDAADHEMVGPWIASIFDSFQLRDGPRIPVEFRVMMQ